MLVTSKDRTAGDLVFDSMKSPKNCSSCTSWSSILTDNLSQTGVPGLGKLVSAASGRTSLDPSMHRRGAVQKNHLLVTLFVATRMSQVLAKQRRNRHQEC